MLATHLMHQIKKIFSNLVWWSGNFGDPPYAPD
jgi:hypothetical protein